MALIDKTGDIINSFLNNNTIAGWVAKIGGSVPNISSGMTPSSVFPAIVVYTVFNTDGDFADDEAYSSKLRYQITLFSESAIPKTIVNEVDDLIKSIGFTRNNCYPLYDDSTKKYQTVMLYDMEPTY